MTRKRDDGRNYIKGGHDEIRLVQREEITGRCGSRLFAERAWDDLLEKIYDYTGYPMLEELDCVTGYLNIPLA